MTYQPYWTREVIGFFTAYPLYPCQATGTTKFGADYDFTFINAADLQQLSHDP